MERYLWVNPERINSSQKRDSVDGIEIAVELSPYDMPNAVTGAYRKEKGLFAITFQYIDRESPARHPKEYDGVQVVEGRYSGKILSISIPIDAPPHDKVGVISLLAKMRTAFTSRREMLKGHGAFNQKVAEEILAEKELEALAGIS